jgi:hypothetical protein
MLNRKLITWSAIFMVVLYLLNFRLTTPSSTSHWTVYGTNGCGWTRKQLDHMKKNNIPHTYIQCDKQDCGDIDTYPTLKNSSGQTIVGFKKI